MTLPYERANVRPSVQSLGEGEGSLTVARAGELTIAIFSLRDAILLCGVDNIMFSWEGLTEAESEREESGAKITSNRKLKN